MIILSYVISRKLLIIINYVTTPVIIINVNNYNKLCYHSRNYFKC